MTEPSEKKPYAINKLSNKTAEILIYEQIGSDWFEEGITAKQFAKDLKEIGEVKRLDIRINSVGGSVQDGVAIYNALDRHPSEKHVYIDGWALSMASGIAMVGKTVNMAANALLMIHDPAGMAWGTSDDMRRTADVLDKIKDTLVVAYARKSGKTEEEIGAAMKAETWFTADEAREFGLVDDVTPELHVAACGDITNLPLGLVAPEAIRERFSNSLPDKEMKSMSDPKPDKVAATLAELKALDGADDSFVVAQLEKGATVSEAMAALNAKLVADLKAANEAIAKQKTDKPQPQPPQNKPADPAPNGEPEGLDPLVSNTKPRAAEDTTPTPLDTFNAFKTEFNKKRAAGMSAEAAMKACYTEHPEWKEAANKSFTPSAA